MVSTRSDAEARKKFWLRMSFLACTVLVFLGVGYYLGIRKHTTGYLIEQLNNGHLDNQICAVRVLREKLDNETVTQATIRALNSPHSALCIEALRALAWHGRLKGRFLEPVSKCLLGHDIIVSNEAALVLGQYPLDVLDPALPTIGTALLENEHIRDTGFTLIIAQLYAGPYNRDWAISVLVELLKAPRRKIDRIRAMQILSDNNAYSPEVFDAVLTLLKKHVDEEGYLAALFLAKALVRHPNLLGEYQDAITKLPKTGPVLLLQDKLNVLESAE
jgi:hypothetical protein